MFAIVTHYAMALTLGLEWAGIFPPRTATVTTPAAGMVELLGPHGAVVGFLSAALCAHLALILNGRVHWYFRVALLLWQQTVMMVTTLEILGFVLQGQYADGYVAHWSFILSDQIDGSLILGVLHTAALIHFISFLIVKGERHPRLPT